MSGPELTAAQARLLRAAVAGGESGVRLERAAWLPAQTLGEHRLIRERRIRLGGIDYRAAIATAAGRRWVELDDAREKAALRVVIDAGGFPPFEPMRPRGVARRFTPRERRR